MLCDHIFHAFPNALLARTTSIDPRSSAVPLPESSFQEPLARRIQGCRRRIAFTTAADAPFHLGIPGSSSKCL